MGAYNQGKQDTILKEFWRNNAHFAALFNAVLFGGREVIDPDSLEEQDTDMSGSITVKDHTEGVVRIRDVLKKSKYGFYMAILGLESQTHIHYAMPLRSMLYDALDYLKQYREIVAKYKKDTKELETSDEFLSRMRKEDRFCPVITIVVYYGEEQWDGPVALSDMMETMPEEIRNAFSDYKMNLVQVCDSGKYTFSDPDVQTVFEISRQLMEKQIDQIKEKYKGVVLSREVAATIGSITQSKELLIQTEKEEEGLDMCRALEEWKQENIEEGKKLGKEEGRAEGREEAREEGIINSIFIALKIGVGLPVAIEKVALQYHLPEETIREKWESRKETERL